MIITTMVTAARFVFAALDSLVEKEGQQKGRVLSSAGESSLHYFIECTLHLR